MKTMRFRSFLKGQIVVLALAVFSTAASLFIASDFLRAGVGHLLEPNSSALVETFRGQPNPGGSSAFAAVFPSFVAVICWWSILSDWKEARRRADRGQSKKTAEQE
jgi:hypothetical protein